MPKNNKVKCSYLICMRMTAARQANGEADNQLNNEWACVCSCTHVCMYVFIFLVQIQFCKIIPILMYNKNIYICIYEKIREQNSNKN